MTDWPGKLTETVVRIAGILHMLDYAVLSWNLGSLRSVSMHCAELCRVVATQYLMQSAP